MGWWGDKRPALLPKLNTCLAVVLESVILSAPVRYTKFLESNRASARRVATCPGPVILVTIALDQLGTETPGSKAHNASQLCWKRTLPVWPPLTLPVGDHGAWRFPSSIIHELFVEYRTLAFEVGSIAAHAQAHKQIFALIYELQSEVNSRLMMVNDYP